MHRTSSVRAWSACSLLNLLLLALALASSTAHAGRIEVIALTGDASPDGNGTLIEPLTTPVVNDRGEVAYTGRYGATSAGAGDDRAVLLYDDVGTQLILREGWVPPDGNGVLDQAITPSLNEAGEVALWAEFRDHSSGFPNKGIVKASASGVSLVFREGGAATGGLTHRTLHDGDVESVLPFDDLGSVTILSVRSNFSRTIVRGDGTAQVDLVAPGDDTPTMNGTYSSNLGLPMTLADGTIAFQAFSLQGSDPLFASVLVLSQGGVQTEIVRPDVPSGPTPAPDGNGAFDAIGAFDANRVGQVAFAASFENTSGGQLVDDFGVLKGDGASLVFIARAGDPAPSGNGAFKAAFPQDRPLINDFGDVVFRAEFVGTAGGADDDHALVRGNFESPLAQPVEEWVREGQLAPGGGVFDSISSPRAQNEAGVVAFEATLRDVPPGAGVEGYFLTDGIDLVEVVRLGQTIDGVTIGPPLRGGGFRLHEGSLNEHGQVAFQAEGSANGQQADGVYLFTPDLYWRGSGPDTWESKRNIHAHVNDAARAGWTLSLIPSEVHDVFIRRGIAGVAGPVNDTTVRTLSVGHQTPGFNINFHLKGSHLAATEGFFIGNNSGVIDGPGELSGALTLFGNGQLWARGLVVNDRIENDGIVQVRESFGTFHGQVVNRGEVQVGRELSAAVTTGTFHGDFVNEGAFFVRPPATADVFGDYTGPGTIHNEGVLTFHGGFFPGASPAYTEIAGGGTTIFASGAGTEMEIGGIARGSFHGDPAAEYDSITLLDGGTLTLQGTLTVTLISPDGIAPVYQPVLGDAFTLFEAQAGGSILGDFDAPLGLPDLGSDLRWLVHRDAQHFALEVAAVPLPPSALLLASALAGFLLRHGRAQRPGCGSQQKSPRIGKRHDALGYR